MSKLRTLFSGIGGKKDVDMTEGNILHHLVSFAFPLLIGNLFQQLYNMVDTWVVGNFVSNDAFAAVGTVAPIINTLIGFFTGLATGAGVVISQYYGARRYSDVRQAVHTAITVTVIIDVLFTVIGVSLTPLALKLIKMPDSAIQEATSYLTIYFAGMTGLMFYNMGAGILRAIGDSRHPFYFLAVCAGANIALDLVFVLVFGMGVEGVALATVLSQAISAVLVIITLLRTDTCVKLEPKQLRIYPDKLRKIFVIGIPSALQLAITAFSNIFVQSYINYFENDCMSGWTAYSKVDQLIFLPITSIGLAVSTFVGQNMGKNQPERAQKGVKQALFLSLGCTVTLMIPVMIFAPSIVYFFNQKAEVVIFGSLFLRVLSPFYLFCCVNQIFANALRGAGDSKAPMFIMLGSFVVFRQIYLFTISHVYNAILPIAMGYPLGWILCGTTMFLYYRRTNLSKTRIVA